VRTDVGRVALRLETAASGRARANVVARELRDELPRALEDARTFATGEGVVLVPKMRVTLRAPLARVRGRDLARAIAEACLEAAATRSVALVGGDVAGPAAATSAAERILAALRQSEGVRVASREEEAAAWLLALARGERSRLPRASPHDDLERLSTPRAFAELMKRVDSPDALLDALSPRFTAELAARCADADARNALVRLDACADVPAEIWRAVAQRFAALSAHEARAPWRAALFAVVEAAPRDARAATVAAAHTFAAACDTRGARPSALARGNAASEARDAAVREAHLDGAPKREADAHDGTTSANDIPADVAAALVAAARRDAGGAAHESPYDVALASDLTGLWCLLPHVARLTAHFDERSRRAAALAVAQVLAGTSASDDPAIACWCGEERAEDLLAALPANVQPHRLAVAAVRRFARSLRHFEQARCTYVLRAILSGPGDVIRRRDGWDATLPRAPLRVILDRAALIGPLETPWEGRFAFVRDDG
jgi:2-phospho-L-lactate guanylyltransferase (CobY/MobA/RfbA family)